MAITAAGTHTYVMEGVVDVSDIAQKKTVAVAAGQSVSVPNGGIPTEPTSFDPQSLGLWFELPPPTPTWYTFTFGLLFAAIFLYVATIMGRLVFRIAMDLRPMKRKNETVNDVFKRHGMGALRHLEIATLLLVVALGALFMVQNYFHISD